MIILIDNYDSFTYNLYQALSLFDPDVRVIPNDAMDVEEIGTMGGDGIVISPGGGRPEDAGVTMELIRKLGDQVPILGVCLGHQAIGAVFGGDVERAEEILHGKQSLIFHTRGALFKGVSLPFQAGRYHSLIVSEKNLPAELLVEAEDAAGHIMALRHRTYPIFGVQFHPESILTPEGEKILKNFVELCHVA